MLLEPKLGVSSSAPREDIKLDQYFQVVFKHWRSIIVIAAIFGLAAYFVLSTKPTLYKATATLLIESEQKNVVSIEEIYGGIDSKRKEYYLTQFEILKSKSIAFRVIQQLQLDELPEFTGAGKTASGLRQYFPFLFSDSIAPQPLSDQVKQRRVLNSFLSRLEIVPIPQTQLVNISFKSESPDLAAKIVNTLGETYINSNLEARMEMTNQASSWMGGRIEQLKKELHTSETAFSQFLEEQNLVDVQGIDSLASFELNELNNRLAKVKEQRLSLESLLSQLKLDDKLNLSSLIAIDSISNNPQLRDLRIAEVQAERKVSELSKRYGPKHDTLLQAQAQLEAIKGNIALLLGDLQSGLLQNLATVRQQEKSLTDELADKKSQFQSLVTKKATYDRLKSDIDTNRQLLDMFLTRLKETSATSDFKAANARFSDKALKPLNPVGPGKSQLLVIAIALGGLVGIALSFIRESLYDTVEKVAQVEDKLNLYTLGSLPKIKGDIETRLNTLAYRNALGACGTMLQFNMLRQKRKAISVTSALSNEGKTSFSISLAKSMAASEKVLLIDGDIRHHEITRQFGLDDSSGLSGVVLYGKSLSECVYSVPDSGLDILPIGALPTSPMQILSSNELRKMILHAEKEYDRIIVDTPPTLMVKDALVFAELTKGAILLVKAGKTKTRQILAAANLLLKHKISMDGVVLNQIDKKYATGYYGYGIEHSTAATAGKEFA